jgi:uncharacterized protein YjbK
MKKYGKPPKIFKVGITASLYESLIKEYEASDIKDMIYVYFDTSVNPEEASLRKIEARLRLRIKNGKYSLEFKRKKQGSIEEIKQELNHEEACSLFQGYMPTGKIKVELDKLQIKTICNIKSTQTRRAKKPFRGGILVLDKTCSRGKIFYEIEFRSFNCSFENVQRLRSKFNLGNRTALVNKLIAMWCA